MIEEIIRRKMQEKRMVIVSMMAAVRQGPGGLVSRLTDRSQKFWGKGAKQPPAPSWSAGWKNQVPVQEVHYLGLFNDKHRLSKFESIL